MIKEFNNISKKEKKSLKASPSQNPLILQNLYKQFQPLLLPNQNIYQIPKKVIHISEIPNKQILLFIVTSEELLNIFAKRAYSIGRKLNLITEQNYFQALTQAQKCDKIRKNNPKNCKRELFGIPISIKDTFDLQGTPSTIGVACRLNYIPKEDGTIVKILKEAGAIIFVKSNIPQVAMSCESVNFIYGRGLNPWNQSRNIGGSSGGEGGLIAARCSPLGLATDIGGSIRNPCAMNGVTGIKPTVERITSKGRTPYSPGFDGQQTIKSSSGPISKYVDDSVLLLQALLNNDHHTSLPLSQQDFFHTNKPWDNTLYTSKNTMKIAYFTSLPLFNPPKAVQRAVEESVNALKNQGNELIQIDFPTNLYEEAKDLFTTILGSDGYACISEILQGEKKVAFNKKLALLFSMGQTTRKVLALFLNILGQKRLAKSLKKAKILDANEYRISTFKVMNLRQKFVEYMQNNDFQAIICPTVGVPTGIHDYSLDCIDSLVYLYIWNVFNVPAGVVPVSVIKENEQFYKEDYFNDIQTKTCKKSMENSKGLPLTVQIIGLPMQEETVLNIMKQIETQVQFHQKHPYPQI